MLLICLLFWIYNGFLENTHHFFLINFSRVLGEAMEEKLGEMGKG